MTAIKGEIDAGQLAQTAGQAATSYAAKARTAAKQAAEAAAREIEEKGRADIAAAGNFGGRWTSGFQAAVGGGDNEITITVTESAQYWQVFQYGALIRGRPLLYFQPTKAVGGLEGKPLPLLISKHQVTIPKKFHLIETVQAEMERLPLLFRASLSAEG